MAEQKKKETRRRSCGRRGSRCGQSRAGQEGQDVKEDLDNSWTRSTRSSRKTPRNSSKATFSAAASRRPSAKRGSMPIYEYASPAVPTREADLRPVWRLRPHGRECARQAVSSRWSGTDLRSAFASGGRRRTGVGGGCCGGGCGVPLTIGRTQGNERDEGPVRALVVYTRRVDLRQLEIFAKVAERGSFSGLPKPVLTQPTFPSISARRGRIGLATPGPTRRGAAVTPAGRLCAPRSTACSPVP